MTIQNLSLQDISYVLDLKYEVFSQIWMSKQACDEYTMKYTDRELSIGLFDNHGQILGCYLLGRQHPYQYLTNKSSKARSKRIIDDQATRDSLAVKSGIQGVSIYVHPSIQGKGFGKMLIDYPSSLGYDYIRGLQSHKLNNLDHRLRQRTLLAHSHINYMTIQVLS